MPNGISVLFEGLGPAADVFSGIAALAAVLAYLTEFVRGRSETRSFRPIWGWTVAILASFGLVAALYALHTGGLSPLEPEGRLLGIVVVITALLVPAGVLTAVRTPSLDRSALAELASAVEAFVQRCESDDHFVRGNRVALGLRVSHEFAWSGKSTSAKARDLESAGIPTASVAVLVGPAGSGKTVELRSHVVAVCRRARQRRRPRELAVYVSVGMLKDIEGKITQDTIAEQLSEAVREDNSELGIRLLNYLNGGPSKLRWFFAFDLGVALTREQEEAYFQAVRNFMRHRDRDRAVIAVRRRFPDARPVCTPCPPSPHQVRELLGKQEMSDAAEIIPVEIAANPALIMQFGVPSRPLDDALDAFISQRLRHAALHETTDKLRVSAASVAFRLVFGAGDQPVLDSEIAPLLAARLGQIEHGSFAFRFDLLLTHLAADHLVRVKPLVSLEQLGRDEVSRAVLLAALRGGGEEFQDLVVNLVESWVQDEVDVPEHLDTTLPPIVTFSWPPPLFHVLSVLSDAVREGIVVKRGQRLQRMIDHLLWLGVFAGSWSGRESSLSLLGLASPQRVLEIYRQATKLNDFDFRTDSLIAAHVRQADDGADHVPLQERAAMLSGALEAWGRAQYLPRKQPVDEDQDGLLVAMLRGVLATEVTVLSACAVVALLVGASENPVRLAIGLLLTLIFSYLAWKLRAHPRALSDRAAKCAHWVMPTASLVCGIALLFVTLGLLVSLTSGDLLVVVRNAALVWLFSWPFAMAAQVVHDPFRKRRWLFPQQIVLELRTYREELAQLKQLLSAQTNHLRSRKRLIPIGMLLALIASLTIDLPLAGEDEVGVDGLIGLTAGIAILVLSSSPRVKAANTADLVGRRIVDGTMTSEALLQEISARAESSNAQLTQLLKMLATAPPGAVAPAVEVLNSFDNLLEFLERTLPKPPPGLANLGAIKPRMWSYAPAACSPEMIEWAERFDQKHTGFLVRLAHSESDRALLGNAIKAATS